MLYFNQSESFLRTKKREEEESGLANEFSKGVSSGVDQLQGLIGGGGRALVGSLSGNDDLFYSGMNYYNEQMDEAAENAAEVGRIEDIDGVGDFLKYSAFVVGNILPSVVGTGGVGAAGGVLAKKAAMMTASRALVKQSANQLSKKQAGTLYSLSTVGREALAKRGLLGQKAGAFAFGASAGAGESFTRIFDETGEEAAITALATGIVSGGLDAMMPLQALKRILPQEQFQDAAAAVGDQILRKQSVVGRALKEAGKAAGTEGITEMMQEIVQNASLETIRGMNDPSLEDSFVERMLDEGKRGQYLNAFVAGSIGGGFIGGVTGAITKDPDDAPSVTRQKLLTADGTSQEQLAADETVPKAIDDTAGTALEVEQTALTTQPKEIEQTDLTVQPAALEVDESDNVDPRLTDEGGTRVQQQRERMDQNEQFENFQTEGRAGGVQQATDNRQQVQADIREEVTGIDPNAERVPTDGRQAAIEKAQDLPDQRVARDTAAAQAAARKAVQEQLASQADLRGSMKALLTRIEVDALVQSDRQFDESEVQPNTAPPTVVEQTAAVIAEPDTMSGLLGKEVDYQGFKGLLVRKAEGYYVSSGAGDILVESGESKSPAELGIAATDQSVVFENDIEFDAATKTFMLYGKKYKVNSFIRDSNGKPISISAKNSSGRIVTIRNPELASRLDLKVNPPDSIVQSQISFSDLPVSVQTTLFDASKNSGEPIPDSVSYDVAIAASQGDPEAVQSVENLARFQRKEDTALDMTQTFTGDINRSENTEVAAAIDSYNQSIKGTDRSPLDEQQLNELLNFADSSQNESISGTVVLSASDFYQDENSPERQELLLAIVDLVANGLPKSVLKTISGVGITVQGEHRTATDSPAGTYRISTKSLYLDSKLLSYAVDNEDAARRLRFVIAHELGHAQDLTNGVTASSVSFSVALDSIGSDQVILNLGNVVSELHTAFVDNTDLGKEMTYPFNLVFEMVNRDVNKVDKSLQLIKREAYAQAFAVFHSNPSLLQKEAPLAYTYFTKMLRTAEGIQNGESNIQTDAIDPSSEGIQGDVQPSTGTRGLQVKDQRGAGEDGGDRDLQGQASEELGGEAVTGDGVNNRRPVQVTVDPNENRSGRNQERLKERAARPPEGVDEDSLRSPPSSNPQSDDLLASPVSTRFPTGKRRTEDPIADLIVNDYESFASAGALFSKNIALIKSYTNLTKEEQVGSDEVVAERFINHMVDNLLYIYDSVPDSTRSLSKQWYEGANKIVQRMADKHGISLAQASAVAANLSPQKDWYQNASLAERVIDIYHENINDSFDQNMKDKADVIYFHKDVKPPARITNRQKLDLIQSKSLQQLIDEKVSPHVLGMWVRTWDQTYNSPSYRLVSPDGKFLDYATNADGKTQSKAAWGSLSEIGKALKAVMNPEIEVLSESLGDANKVRNFYNNIFDPASDLGFVTIDTHAVAAALMRPLGGKAEEVAGNFGTQKGSANSTVTGHKGTYSLYEEAYRRAAKEKGVLPREMQSITWEAVRGLFTSTYKAQKQNVAFVQGVWNQYNKGKLSLDEARDKINDHSGGIERPSWERSDFTIPDESSDTSYETIVLDGDISRPESGLQEATGSGTGVDAAGVSATQVSPEQDLLFSPPSRPVGRPNTSVIPEVNAAYQNFKAGEISQQDFDTVVRSTISEYDFVPTPATYDEMNNALTSDKKPKINLEIEDGELVGMRLDIPAYMNKENSAWVPALHFKKDGVSRSSYQATGNLKGVTFSASQKTSQLIMDAEEGKAAIDKQLADGLIDAKKAKKLKDRHNKSSYAKMNGSYVNRTDAENEALAKEALNDPDWIQVGFDPRRHSYFYDRKTGQPILSADEVIQVGPLVLAKNSSADGQTSSDFLYSPAAPTYEEENAARYAAIREEKGVIDGSLSWIKTNFKRELTSRGLLNEEVFQSMVSRDGEIGAVDIDVRMLIRNYDEAIKNNFETMTPEIEASLTAAMATPVNQIKSLDLPDDIKNSIGKMRQYVDKLSLDYSFILLDEIQTLEANDKSDAAKSKVELLKIIAGNTGKYVNRSFRVFDDPAWARSVPDEVLEAATNYLVEQGAPNPDRIINTILKDGSGKAFAGISSFIRETTLGSKDLSIIKKKKDIAEPILALMGEYKDPRINFAKTSTKLSRLVFNHRFLQEVRLKGEGVFLFTEDNAPTGSYVQLAADASDAMAPLNGLYTTPELKQGFIDATEQDSLRGFFGVWQSLNSFVKYGKTVVAPTTIARNFMSASLFTVANGHFNWSEAGRSMESMVSYFNSEEGGPTAYLRELKRLGVMYDTPRGSELVKALEDSFGTGSIDREVSRNINLSVSGAKDFAVAGMDFFAKFYQFGDDFWKIIGFENQVTVFMGAKGMSREEAMPLAAERIRDTYPTYSLIGRSIKKLRTFPLVGTFVSFPAEIIRTTYNMLRYIRQDMADPDMRGHAAQRILGMSMVSAGIYAMQDAAMRAWGVDEDEEEALRLMSPHWSENSNILPTGRDEKGNLEYIDLTYLDPYAYLKKPLNALLRDQPMDDAIAQVGRELLSPFFGVDIAAGAFLEVYQNEKVSGGRIFNPADSAENITAEIGSHLGKSLLPSILQNVQRTAKAINGDVSKSGKRYVLEDELLAWVGFRSTTFDPKIALHFKAYEFNEAKRDATSILTSTFRDPNSVEDADLADAFYTASAARREGYERMIKLVSAARSSGLTNTQLMMVLSSNGVTKKDARALIKGDIDSWSLSDSTLKNTLKKSDLLFGKEKSQQFEDRWNLITQLLRDEN